MVFYDIKANYFWIIYWNKKLPVLQLRSYSEVYVLAKHNFIDYGVFDRYRELIEENTIIYLNTKIKTLPY